MTDIQDSAEQPSALLGRGYNESAYDASYKAAVSRGYVGTEEEWKEFVTKSLAEAPKEGYVEKMTDAEKATNFVEQGDALLQKTTDNLNSVNVGMATLLAGALPRAEEAELSTENAPALPFAGSQAKREAWIKRLEEGRIYSGLTPIYPIDPEREYDMKWQRRITAMLRFYDSLTTTEYDGIAIYTYMGFAGNDEIRWVRFETDTDEKGVTFAVLEKNFDRWVQACLEDETIAWCVEGNGHEGLQKRGLNLNVSKAPIELPLDFFFTKFGPDGMEDLFDGDFTALEELSGRLQQKITAQVRDATLKSNVLTNAPGERDHDLMLVFKALKGFTGINVVLEKVWPKLPESGELSLGDNPENELKWSSDKKSLVAIRLINAAGRHINKEIEKARLLVSQHPVIQQAFAERLKTMLIATSAFTKRVYNFDATYGQHLIEEVGNDVLRRLTTKAETGAVIGLDVNSWIVWEYKPDSPPERVTDEDLDFVNLLFNRYTETFINALYVFLINLGNPLIKPYDYRIKADMSDGIAIGTMRRVK